MPLKIIHFIVEGSGNMLIKLNYSAECDLDDENLNNPCEKCLCFIFPVGCIMHEDFEAKEEIYHEVSQM